jgi:hypothetical protein
LVDLTGNPEVMEEDGDAAGEGDGDTVLVGGGGVELGDGPAAEVRVRAAEAEGEVGGLDEEGAEIGIALLGDGEVGVAVARLAAAGGEAEVGADVAAAGETVRVSEGEDEGEGGDGADTGDLHEGAGVGEVAVDDALEEAVEVGDASGEGVEFEGEGCEGGLEGEREVWRGVAMEVAGITGGERRAEGLGGAAAVVDEECAAADESVAGADDGEGGLGGFWAVRDRSEEVGAEAAETGEGEGIDTVGLLGALGDELEAPGVGDDDLMAEGGDEAGDPGGVGAGFDDDPCRGEVGEAGSEGRGGGDEAGFLEEVAGGVDGGEAGGLVAEVEGDGEGWDGCGRLHSGPVLLHLIECAY